MAKYVFHQRSQQQPLNVSHVLKLNPMCSSLPYDFKCFHCYVSSIPATVPVTNPVRGCIAEGICSNLSALNSAQTFSLGSGSGRVATAVSCCNTNRCNTQNQPGKLTMILFPCILCKIYDVSLFSKECKHSLFL